MLNLWCSFNKLNYIIYTDNLNSDKFKSLEFCVGIGFCSIGFCGWTGTGTEGFYCGFDCGGATATGYSYPFKAANYYFIIPILAWINWTNSANWNLLKSWWRTKSVFKLASSNLTYPSSSSFPFFILFSKIIFFLFNSSCIS